VSRNWRHQKVLSRYLNADGGVFAEQPSNKVQRFVESRRYAAAGETVA
jgi:hypothetical protein